jgi:hypothetical protein
MIKRFTKGEVSNGNWSVKEVKQLNIFDVLLHKNEYRFLNLLKSPYERNKVERRKTEGMDQFRL